MEEKKQITSKQLVMLVFIMGMSIKIFMMPVLLLKISGRDSYITVAIALALELICLFFLLKASKLCPDMTFFDIIRSCIGKIAAKIITAVFAVYFFVKLMLVISDIKVFFIVSVFETLPWPIFVIPLLALLAFIFVKGLRNLARTTEIFTPFIIVSAVIMCALMAIHVDFGNLFPVLENGFAPIGKGLIRYPLWYGDFSVFILFLGKIKRVKSTNMTVMISASIAAMAVLFFGIIIFAAYANVADILMYGQNITDLTQVTLSGFNIGRVDILLFCVWMITVFIKAALLFDLTAESCLHVLNVKNKVAISIVLATVLYILLVFVIPNELIFRSLAESAGLPIMIIQYSVPVIITVCALINYFKSKKVKKVCLYEG